MSEADIGAMAVEVEPSHQNSVTFCCHATNGSRGAVWQKQRCVTEFLHAEKNGIHWCSSTPAEHLWRPNSECEHSEAVGGAFQQWQQRQWVASTGAEFDKHNIQGLVHHREKCKASDGDCVEKECFVAENLLCQTMHFLSAVASMEVNRRYYFQRDPRMCLW